MRKAPLVLGFLTGGVFLLLDQYLKWMATHQWTTPVVNKYLGWQPFFNAGIGFGIPLPNFIILFFSLIIIGLIFYLIITSQNTLATFTLLLIFCGALSNFIDRLYFRHTIDYIFLVTGFINIADILIVVGFVLYFLHLSKLKR